MSFTYAAVCYYFRPWEWDGGGGCKVLRSACLYVSLHVRLSQARGYGVLGGSDDDRR